MDYGEINKINLYNDIDECIKKNKVSEVYALTKFANENAYKKSFVPNDAFIFGNETSGLPKNILQKVLNKNKIRIPMLKSSRSLNLSNSVSIILYEAWRQNNFLKAKTSFLDK